MHKLVTIIRSRTQSVISMLVWTGVLMGMCVFAAPLAAGSLLSSWLRAPAERGHPSRLWS